MRFTTRHLIKMELQDNGHRLPNNPVQKLNFFGIQGIFC